MGNRPAIAMVGGLIGEDGVLREAVKGIALTWGATCIPGRSYPNVGRSGTRCARHAKATVY